MHFDYENILFYIYIYLGKVKGEFSLFFSDSNRAKYILKCVNTYLCIFLYKKFKKIFNITEYYT